MFDLHAANTRVKTSAGDLKILKDIDSGGEGQGYFAELHGDKAFYKKFHQKAEPPLTPVEVMQRRKARTVVLVDAALHKLDPRINAPFAWSDEGGYVCGWIENMIPLARAHVSDGESFLGVPRPYKQRVGVLLQLCDLLCLVHAKGFSHGDLNKSNICVVVEGDKVTVYLIDWSNFNNGDPKLPPLMAGSDGSMAFWVRSEKAPPDRQSDIQSLAIYAHGLLLDRSFLEGCKDQDECLARLTRGDIPGDPLLGGQMEEHAQGLRFSILSPDLQSLMRGMLRPDRRNMPTIDEFSRALQASLPNLISCPNCNSPLWWHAARKCCPQCSAALPAPLHITVEGKQIPIGHAMVLGRSSIGGDAAVSSQHFRVYPLSPGVGSVTVMGINGLKRQRGFERVKAEPGQSMDIVRGDRLEIPQVGGKHLVLEVS